MKVFSQLLLLSLSLRLYTAKAWVSTTLRTDHNKQFQFSTPTIHDSKAPSATAKISNTNTILQQTSSNENEDMLINVDNGISWLQENSKILWTSTITAMLALAPSIANAAAAASTKPVNKLFSAAVAYGHYASLLIVVACVTIERFTIRPNMSFEEEKLVAKADICLGITGAVLLATGYIRATNLSCGKGWAFYSHEPIFWMQMIAVAAFGAASFFPTTKIIQRSVDQRVGKFTPMSERLAERLIQVLNAELLALFSIPFLATLMSRGVAYNDKFPWQIEAAFVPIVSITLGTKFIREALDWKEDGSRFTIIDRYDLY